MFTTLAYNASLGVNAANSDMTAASEPDWSRRNSHYIFTEPYRLVLASYIAANATEARFNVPRWRALTNAYHHVWPVNRSATIPSQPRVVDYRDYQLDLPMQDEIAVEGSNNLGAATESSTCFLWMGTPDWSRNLPRGLGTMTVRATVASYTSVANDWSAAQAITFTETLAGGWYALVGAAVFVASSLAARFIFPRGNVTNGRKFRPGVLTTEATGNLEADQFRGGMGLMGNFHTFELPTYQSFDIAAAARAPVLKMDLVYLGQTQPAGY